MVLTVHWSIACAPLVSPTDTADPLVCVPCPVPWQILTYHMHPYKLSAVPLGLYEATDRQVRRVLSSRAGCSKACLRALRGCQGSASCCTSRSVSRRCASPCPATSSSQLWTQRQGYTEPTVLVFKQARAMRDSYEVMVVLRLKTCSHYSAAWIQARVHI
jgi:hypothetical protein